MNLIVAAALALAAVPSAASDAAKGSWDGLVEVKSHRFDDVFLMPGADFRPYTKVMLDPVEVAFRKDWMRNMNDSVGVDRRVTQEDALKILSTVQADTGDIFREAFTKAGHEVVAAPGEGVLRVRSAVMNLYVNAPDTLTAGRVRTFTAEAGEATLVLELRDSLTNALLARIVDRRVVDRMPGISNSVTNQADFRREAKSWAGASVKGLDALKAQSPIPAELTPGQKLN
jgi:hypothetical protein